MAPHRTRGFTLAELLIALILLAIVGDVVVRLLAGSQRLTRAQSEQTALQASVRAGALLVPAELRELGTGAAGADLLIMGPDSITYRAQRAVGVACAVTATTIVLRSALMFAYRAPGGPRDSVLLYLEGNPASALDDAWQVLAISGAPSAGSCPDGSAALDLPTAVPAGVLAQVVTDAPVRTFEVMQMRLYRSGGQYWLGSRSVSAGEATIQPMLGPLKSNGFQLDYLDAAGAPAALASDVRSIDVTIRGVTDAPVSAGLGRLQLAEDSLRARVRLRNAPRP